jgi:toxin FitB
VILLDTNVVSELMAPRELASQRVLRWVESVQRDQLATTSVNLAESLYGAQKLDDGRRKELLLQSIEQVYLSLFAGRILPFNKDAAREFARLVAESRRAGRTILEFDAQIAAIARASQLPLATRDGDFADCGVTVINPWEHAA